MHDESDGIEPGRTEPEPDWITDPWLDDSQDPGWPDDWPHTAWADDRRRPLASGVPSLSGKQARHGPRILALALTAVVALGAGAGAVYLYRSMLAGSAVAAAPSASSSARAPSGGGTVESMTLLGQVVAVGRDYVTVGGGPMPAVRAEVTSATRFTGRVRSLARVRVGDTVTVQITESDGVARVVTLQDPASES